MGHSSRSTDIDERVTARGRLEALRLGQPTGGWVPGLDELPIGGSSLTDSAPPGAPSDGPGQPDWLGAAWLQDRLPPWSQTALERAKLRTIVVAALVTLAAVVVGGVVFVHHRSAASGYPSYDASNFSGDSATTTGDPATSPASTESMAPTVSSSDPSSIVVDVGGRVRKPGLVTLPAGSRVADALAAAGGPLHHKEIRTTNLAAKVADGQLLLIGVPEPASDPASGSTDADDGTGGLTSAAPVSLSTASIDELETLPGVGPVTAQKIIDWRVANNGFTSVEQLQQVSGIGPAHYAAISPLVTP